MDRNRVARAVGLIAWGYLLLCFHLTVGTIVLVPVSYTHLTLPTNSLV